MNEEQLVMQILERLLELNTINPPGNEKEAALYLHRLFTSYGIACEVQDIGDNRANFIAELGDKNGKTLEFNGHLDVVPFSGEWSVAPLAATEKNGRIYGRGSSDMKGGVAAMCAAAIVLAQEKKPLCGTLRLAFVADEEHVNKGVLAYQAHKKPAELAVIGEPTDLEVAVAHRGVARFFVDLHGVERHAALSPKGETAITLAAKAVLALQHMNETVQHQTHEVLPPPSMVVTMLQGYEKDNVVPADVRLLTDYRLFPDTTEEQAKNEIAMAISSAG
ncbi:MAG: M20/M25/M40 family metallo-hydrolase, partial [Ruthenibacterium sp.]